MPRIIITEPTKPAQPYRLELNKEQTSIGRGASNDIQLEAASTSSNHCILERIPGGFQLRDLQSTNGILCDDVRRSVIHLRHGMQVFIGEEVTLDFTLSDEEIAVLESEQAAQAKPTHSHVATKKPQVDDSNKALESFLFIVLSILAIVLGFYIRHYQDGLSAPQSPTEQPAKVAPTE